VALDNTRTSSTSQFQFFNPAVQSTFIIQFQQQLLNGFGLLPNTRFILEARNNRLLADATFGLQVITTVAQVENAYWELVFARENVKVQEAAVATSTKLYGDNKKQVEIGTLAPIEIVRAESEVATDRQNLIVAQTTQLQDQTLLLNAITKNPTADDLLNVEIVPTDGIPTTSSAEMIPLQDALKVAWEKRLEVRQAELGLKNDSIEVRATRNALLPTLTAFGQYSGTGLAGINTDKTQTPPVVTSTGFVDSASTAFGTSFPTYAAGVNLTMALRNRSAQADSARAQLTRRQDETRYQQLKNNILVDVRNALIALQQDQARVEAVTKARELAQQTLDAEQKKYQLGASTVFFVIQAQRDLTAAQGNEIRAKIDLQEAQVAYYKALGRTLDVNHITVADAKGGHVYSPPLIPGAPATAVVAYPVNSTTQ
jgi:outer membrane protein